MFNETWHYVWAGGAIPVNDPRRAVSAVLGGVDYSSSGHGVLYIHANKGITFDLDAIRRANPGDKLVRFCTVVGNTETAAALGVRNNTKTLLADDFEATKVGAFASATYSETGAPAISVGAVCQRVNRVFASWLERVVLFVLGLKCLVKRKEALRGRNLSRDSQASGAPMVHSASGLLVTPEAVFCAPIGHPNHASENPSYNSGRIYAIAVANCAARQCLGDFSRAKIIAANWAE